jgi:hypothetical protein
MCYKALLHCVADQLATQEFDNVYSCNNSLVSHCSEASVYSGVRFRQLSMEWLLIKF